MVTDEKVRFSDWNTTMLIFQIKKIVQYRGKGSHSAGPSPSLNFVPCPLGDLGWFLKFWGSISSMIKCLVSVVVRITDHPSKAFSLMPSMWGAITLKAPLLPIKQWKNENGADC